MGRVQEKLSIPASTLSHHLHRLILTGLVTQERQATTLICRANYPAMDALLGFLAEECCADGVCVRRPAKRRPEPLFSALYFHIFWNHEQECRHGHKLSQYDTSLIRMARHREVRHMASLDDRALADIGLLRATFPLPSSGPSVPSDARALCCQWRAPPSRRAAADHACRIGDRR